MYTYLCKRESMYLYNFYVRVNICVRTCICTFANKHVHGHPHKDGQIVLWPPMPRLFAHDLVFAGSL